MTWQVTLLVKGMLTTLNGIPSSFPIIQPCTKSILRRLHANERYISACLIHYLVLLPLFSQFEPENNFQVEEALSPHFLSSFEGSPKKWYLGPSKGNHLAL